MRQVFQHISHLPQELVKSNGGIIFLAPWGTIRPGLGNGKAVTYISKKPLCGTLIISRHKLLQKIC